MKTVECYQKHKSCNGDTCFKLHMYKTAFSVAHGLYVGIKSVNYGLNGDPVIYARLDGSNTVCEFRIDELTNYCL